MAKFRKQPVEIEAVRWEPDSDGANRNAWPQGFPAAAWTVRGESLLIPTPEGVMEATPGDMIIRGVKGEFYPCKPDVFERSYSSVDAAAGAAPAVEYQIPTRMQVQIAKAFTYHPVKGDQSTRYVAIRDAAKALAITIATKTPESREQSLALTKLEECVMHANASIARNE